MSRTLLNGAQVRVDRPRPLRVGEILNHLHELREIDRDWEMDCDGEWGPVSTEPCAWVAMIEAAALQGAL